MKKRGFSGNNAWGSRAFFQALRVMYAFAALRRDVF
jgi:hypothetical protein